MKLVDWQTLQRKHTLDEMRRLLLSPRANTPERSTRPIVGPLVTWLRQTLWRLVGMRQILEARTAHLVELLTTLETTRPPAYAQLPGHPFFFRAGTWDWDILQSVYTQNEYRLPEVLEPNDVFIDVGTHIGSFAYLALVRGAGRVYCFEPDQANHAIAERNLRPFGDRAQLFRKAVWRSDRSGDTIFTCPDLAANTGGGTLFWREDGDSVDVVALDDVLETATEGGRRRVRVLKVDCEGAEYPMLLTSRKLDRVDHICGEYHEIDPATKGQPPLPERARVAGVQRYDRSAIVQGLERAGFEVQIEHKEGTDLGLFFATYRKEDAK